MTDPQELHTFRRKNPSPIQDTGRSTFNQKVDYRSAEKHHHLVQSPAHQHRNMKNVRSQEKYRMSREDQVMSSMGDNQPERENLRALKRKQNQLIKKIKAQQQRSDQLDLQIEGQKKALAELKTKVQSNQKDIEELKEIEQANESYVEVMEQKKMGYEDEAQQFRQIFHDTERQIETARTSRQQSSFDSYQKSLQAGINDLTRARDFLSENISWLSEDIEELTLQIEKARQIDGLIMQRAG